MRSHYHSSAVLVWWGAAVQRTKVDSTALWRRTCANIGGHEDRSKCFPKNWSTPLPSLIGSTQPKTKR